MLLALALACATGPADSDSTEPDDTGDTAADTGDTDTGADTGDTDTDTDTGGAGDADGDGSPAAEDCDDADADVHPGAEELCDGVDQDCDTLVDEGLPSVGFMDDLVLNGTPSTGGYWYGYDGDDNLVLYGRDANEDGVLETYQRRFFTDGLFSGEEQSVDGVNPSYRSEYELDADGYIVEARVDTDGDGVWNFTYGYEYADGRFTRYWADNDYDGDIDVEQLQEYDADGHMEHYWYDDDGDGVAEVEAWYTYDGDHILGSTSDGDGDGVFEVTGTYTWDGERLLEEHIVGGSYPSRRTYTYVDADDLYDQVDYDSGDDGSIEWRYGYVWTGDWITGQSYDQYADGVDVTTYTYVYDSEGRALSSTVELDGVLTSTSEYEYVDGVQTANRTDVDADGTWDVVALWDPAGNLLYNSVDGAGDGAIDYLKTWTYDERSRQVASTEDTLGDGVLEFEREVTAGYVCGAK